MCVWLATIKGHWGHSVIFSSYSTVQLMSHWLEFGQLTAGWPPESYCLWIEWSAPTCAHNDFTYFFCFLMKWQNLNVLKLLNQLLIFFSITYFIVYRLLTTLLVWLFQLSTFQSEKMLISFSVFVFIATLACGWLLYHKIQKHVGKCTWSILIPSGKFV